LARAEMTAARRRVIEVARSAAASRSSSRRAAPDEAPFEGAEEPFSERATRPPGSAGTDPRLRRCYANLELPEGASLDEVKAAYRRLVRTYHPDRHGGDPAAQRVMVELRTAYETLKDHLERTERA